MSLGIGIGNSIGFSNRKKDGYKSGLPAGYTELQWIENTSNAYIDTGIVTDTTIKVYVEFKKNGSDQYQSVFGSSNASISAPESNFTLQYTSNILDFWLGIANNRMTIETGVKHTFEGYITGCEFDDVTKNIVSNYIKSNVNKNLWLFCNNRANTVDAPFLGEIYRAKVYVGNVLERDYIPCISPNNEVGMYDTVTKTFFKSPNGTAFVAGLRVYEEVIYELYDTSFDGTVNSVVDTGIKLWDGTHNRFKMEVEYQRDTNENNIPVYVCKPDTSPYSGLRLRRINSTQESFIISETVTEISNDGFSTLDNQYGHQADLTVAYNNRNVHNVTRNGDYLKMELNGHVYECSMSNPKTNNLNLLLGCDYQGASGTQRYFKGTIYKFKLTAL